jgi:hypothetical protein
MKGRDLYKRQRRAVAIDNLTKKQKSTTVEKDISPQSESLSYERPHEMKMEGLPSPRFLFAESGTIFVLQINRAMDIRRRPRVPQSWEYFLMTNFYLGVLRGREKKSVHGSTRSPRTGPPQC